MVEKVNTKGAAEAIRACYKARRPLFMWGPPGTGKSAVARSVAEEDGVEFIDLRLVQIDALDLRGMPKVKTNAEGVELMHFVQTSLLPRSGKGYLFLDEFVQAPTLVMNSASELVLDRRVGEYRLPDGWSIIAAGNRRMDRAGTLEMPAHLKNRFIHIEMQPELKVWLNWAAQNDIHPAVISYLKTAGIQSLYKFSADDLAYPTLRTWEYASDILKTGVKGATLRTLIFGSIGEAVGRELLTWIESNVELPSYEETVAMPDLVPIPPKRSTQMIYADSILREGKPADVGALIKFFERIGSDPEMRGYIATQISTSSTPFAKCAEAKKWAADVIAKL